ncbi:hypothetical protein CPB86DRAFT_797617 [Serendipita vermifera]|nr:hypothetical protein CPB86DRAFT_797617 [Serendipita vermifera]
MSEYLQPSPEGGSRLRLCHSSALRDSTNSASASHSRTADQNQIPISPVAKDSTAAISSEGELANPAQSISATSSQSIAANKTTTFIPANTTEILSEDGGKISGEFSTLASSIAEDHTFSVGPTGTDKEAFEAQPIVYLSGTGTPESHAKPEATHALSIVVDLDSKAVSEFGARFDSQPTAATDHVEPELVSCDIVSRPEAPLIVIPNSNENQNQIVVGSDTPLNLPEVPQHEFVLDPRGQQRQEEESSTSSTVTSPSTLTPTRSPFHPNSTYPTVVILQSTPKPTPPDTPIRSLSPAQDSTSQFQTLSPLHALSPSRTQALKLPSASATYNFDSSGACPVERAVGPLSGDQEILGIIVSSSSPRSSSSIETKEKSTTSANGILNSPVVRAATSASAYYYLNGEPDRDKSSLVGGPALPTVDASELSRASGLVEIHNVTHRLSSPYQPPGAGAGHVDVEPPPLPTPVQVGSDSESLSESQPTLSAPSPAQPQAGDQSQAPLHSTQSNQLPQAFVNSHIQAAFDQQNLIHQPQHHHPHHQQHHHHHHLTKMFFLHRDSNSLSPDSNSNSRSDSHSRSPASHGRSQSSNSQGRSRSPDHHHNHLLRRPASHSRSRSPEPNNRRFTKSKLVPNEAGSGLSGPANQSTRNTKQPSTEPVNNGKPSRLVDAITSSNTGSGNSGGKWTSDGKGNSRAGRLDEAHHDDERETTCGQSTQTQIQPSQPSMSPSSQPNSPLSMQPQRQHRLVVRNRKSSCRRSYYTRTPERASSRTRGRFRGSEGGSVGSRVSGNGNLGGSLDAAVASSASGVGSVSTSSGASKLVMAKPHRLHPHPSEPQGDRQTRSREDQLRTAANVPSPSRGGPSGTASQESDKAHREAHTVLLQNLSERARMEALERQVVQSTGQGAPRRIIALESDSEDEDDETSDDESSDGHEDATATVPPPQSKEKGPSQEVVVADDDGSSWSDEDEDDEDGQEVVISRKRAAVNEQRSGPAPPPVRKDARDHHQPQQGHAKPPAHLPHVRSRGTIAQQPQRQHQQRGAASPPTRPPVIRRASAGPLAHNRSAPSPEMLAQAAAEASRQREMFKPLPRESYSSNNLVREKSLTSLSRGGRPSNLTLLLNPNPQMFPQGHPYREKTGGMYDQKLSRSMEEMNARNTGMKSPRHNLGLGFGGLKMTSANPSPGNRASREVAPVVNRAPPVTQVAPVNPAAAPQVPPPKRQASQDISGQYSKSPPPRGIMRSSKSAVALPLIQDVTASSAPRDEEPMLVEPLRQMGAKHPRVPRHAAAAAAAAAAGEPSRTRTQGPTGAPAPQPKRQSLDERAQGSQPRRQGNRLGARPADVELSDSDEEDEPSPQSKVSLQSGRSLAKEHLEAVMGGRDAKKAGLSASKTLVASPDSPEIDSRQTDATSYRPPAPPSSPSVYNPYEAKRAQGHLPHTPTPPTAERSQAPQASRISRPRPHSSYGPVTAAPVAPNNAPSPNPPRRDRRPPATSQPPAPLSIIPQEVPFPYNLPYPAGVYSPRTVRLKMLAAEVPDELRKELLWERKANRIAANVPDESPVPPLVGRDSRGAPGVGRPGPSSTAGGSSSTGGAEEPEEDEEQERLRREREAKERYDKMRTRTWNGVIYQRQVW